MKTTFLFLSIVFIFFSCSNDDDNLGLKDYSFTIEKLEKKNTYLVGDTAWFAVSIKNYNSEEEIDLKGTASKNGIFVYEGKTIETLSVISENKEIWFGFIPYDSNDFTIDLIASNSLHSEKTSFTFTTVSNIFIQVSLYADDYVENVKIANAYGGGYCFENHTIKVNFYRIMGGKEEPYNSFPEAVNLNFNIGWKRLGLAGGGGSYTFYTSDESTSFSYDFKTESEKSFFVSLDRLSKFREFLSVIDFNVSRSNNSRGERYTLVKEVNYYRGKDVLKIYIN